MVRAHLDGSLSQFQSDEAFYLVQSEATMGDLVWIQLSKLMGTRSIVLQGIDCELERTGWSIILISAVGFLIWITVAFLLLLSVPNTHGEPVWAFFPIMLPLGGIIVLIFFYGFLLVIAAHFEKGKVELIYY